MTTRNGLSVGAVELLERFAQIMSVALANSQAQEQLRFRVRLEAA